MMIFLKKFYRVCLPSFFFVSRARTDRTGQHKKKKELENKKKQKYNRNEATFRVRKKNEDVRH